MDNQQIEDLLVRLEEIIGPELTQIVDLISTDPSAKGSYFVEIPEPDSVDLTTDNLASLVARTSNMYGRIARFCGMARAMMKIHEASYKRAYKRALGNAPGSNKESRESYAAEHAAEAEIPYSLYRSMVELAESMEDSCRIASESARKIFDKHQAMQTAQNRESAGYYSDSDYTSQPPRYQGGF